MHELGTVSTIERETLPEVGLFLANQIKRSLGRSPDAAKITAILDWVNFQNPHRHSSPVGWLYRNQAGEIKGVHFATAHDFQHPEFPDRQVRIFISNNIYVDESCRGLPGAMIFQPILQEAKQAIIASNTSNIVSFKFLSKLGAQPASGASQEWIRCTNHQPLIAEAMLRHKLPAWLSHPLKVLPWRTFLKFLRGRIPRMQQGQTVNCENLAETLTATAGVLIQPGRVLRDEAYLRWRYLDELPAQCTDLWHLKAPDGTSGLLMVHKGARGKLGQISAAQIIDAALPVDMHEGALHFFCQQYSDTADLLYLRGGLPFAEELLSRLHFKARKLNPPNAWIWSKCHKDILSQVKITTAEGDGAST